MNIQVNQFSKTLVKGISALVASLALFSVVNSASAELLSQSPVDITPFNTLYAPLSPLTFNYGTSDSLSVINTGSPDIEKSIKANVTGGAPTLTLDGSVYDLLQFHFHADAEHEIDGVNAPMEMHFVHQIEGGSSLLVVGRLIVEGAENLTLKSLFENLPLTSGSAAYIINSIDLSALLPSTLTTFRYSGSLTTAPYTEPVKWNVFTEPLEMSAAQIAAFSAIFTEGNSREVQPLNGRIIETDLVGFSAIPEPVTAVWALGLVGVAFSKRRRPAQLLAA